MANGKEKEGYRLRDKFADPAENGPGREVQSPGYLGLNDRRAGTGKGRDQP